MVKMAAFILFLGYYPLKSQDFRFIATHKAYMDMADSTKTFKDWEACKIPVFLDIKNKNLVMYEEFLHIYNLLDLKEKIDDENRNILIFEASDNKSNICIIEFLHHKASGKDQLYIRWKNYQICYQLQKYE